jgi:hypothetical protein
MPSAPAFDEAFADACGHCWSGGATCGGFAAIHCIRRRRVADRTRFAGAIGRAQSELVWVGRGPGPTGRGPRRFRRRQCRSSRRASAGAPAQYAKLKLAGLDGGPVIWQFSCAEIRARAWPWPADDARDGRVFGGRRGPHLVARDAGQGHGLGIRPRPPRRWRLDGPSAWKLIGYFCLGYPAAGDVRMLETAGWRWRRPAASFPIRR